MKKSLLSPLMVAGLVLVMVLAGGCNRPDQQATLDTPVPVGPQAVQPTLPPAVEPTATLPPNEMPVDLAATVAAQNAQSATTPAAAATPEATPTPMPAQPESPAVVATSTPQPAAVAPTAAPLAPPANGLHTVQPGERLFSIARLYNVNPYAIAQLNRIPAPYLIYPGQTLKIPGGGSETPVPPPPSGATSYTVLPGDSLFRIALRFGKSMQSIAAANGIVNYNLIYPGQVLKIP